MTAPIPPTGKPWETPELTGINPVTLRAWERRYGLIQPERTPKGHRLYTDEHIRLIRRILSLVDKGISIGQVKKILKEKDPLTAPVLDEESQATNPWEDYRTRMLQAISQFDDRALDGSYNDCRTGCRGQGNCYC